ncbi:MAG: hypothetical protein H6581_10275 [Bacteroidia bacterium]|nr:hypothetical protein [Bacteroidia bacterium]
MPDPKTKAPVSETESNPYAYGDETTVCLAPPEFDPQVCEDNGENSGLEGEGESCQMVDPFAPAACMDGDPDPIAAAIGTAVANTKNGWARKTLSGLESTLVATRNILKGAETQNPPPGSLYHPDTYAGWDLKKGDLKNLDLLFQAIHGEDTAKKRLGYLKTAKGGLKGILDQVKRFSKSKDYSKLPGYLDLQKAVDEGISDKFTAVQTAIEATMPVAERPSTKAKSSGSGNVSSSKGFNKEKITDHTKLPGLAAPTGPAPAEGSLEAQVEANMASDFQIVDASVEDFLYVNLPELIAGKGKMKTAKKAWALIRNYRNSVLNPLYGEYVKDPENVGKKEAYEAALANMEKEIGPQVRAIARAWWATDVEGITNLTAESTNIGKDLGQNLESIATATAQPEFDPATLDTTGLKESLGSLKKRIQGVRSSSEDVGMSEADEKYCLNKGYTAMVETGSALKVLGKKKLTSGDLTKLSGHIQKAIDHQKLVSEKLEIAKAAAVAKNDSLKDIIDRINDPEKTPLVKEVKRHKVSVKFTGKEGNETTASYNTKPESTIGIYEDVWSPMSISDQKGSFNRPTGGERGAQVYRDLKGNHGFPEGEAKVLGSVAVGEGDFHSINTVDIMRISLGFIQFAGASFVGLLGDLKKADPAYYQKQFANYGILINDGKSKMPKITTRDTRFKPGQQVDHPAEEHNKNLGKIVVYDHQNRVWVSGLEAMAVLQSDPRYLTLIQSSAGDVEMKLAQVNRARFGYLHPVRKTTVSYADLGLVDPDLPEGSKKKSDKKVKISDVMNNEVAIYAATAWGIAAGPAKGQSLARKFLIGFVKEKGIKTIEELKGISQTELAEYVRRTHDSSTWSRPDKLGEALGSPLSKSEYIGNP